jgi:hypothetical protein
MNRLLLRHCDCFLKIAVVPDAKQGHPFSRAFSPLSQGEIVRDPEQRSTDSHLVFIARRVNNHYTGRYHAKARSKMRFRPSSDNRPMGVAQRQRNIDRWRTEQNSPGNENTRVRGCHLLAYLDRNQIRTANWQRTCFDIRSGYHLVNQVMQCYIITIVAALNVQRATDGDRPLTPPIGKTRRNGYQIVGTAESIHI